jgi:hypothetical protein
MQQDSIMSAMGISTPPVYALTGLSLGNLAGRIGLGTLSDKMCVLRSRTATQTEVETEDSWRNDRSHRVPRLTWVVLSLGVQALVLFIQAFAPIGIITTSVIVGITFGGVYCRSIGEFG